MSNSEGATTISSKEEPQQDPASPKNALTNLTTLETALEFEDNDPDNPKNWTSKKKILIAGFLLQSSFVATFGTPIYVAAIPYVKQEFDVNIELAISPTSFYAFGVGFGCLIGTAACEVYGRRIVYRITVPLLFLFTLLGGFAKNFTTLAVARSFAGLFSGPLITVGVGVLNDLWDLSLEKIGTLFAVLFVLFNILATEVGPMISAAVVKYSWQWTFWINAILLGITLLGTIVLPETFHPQILRTRARKLHQPLPARDSLLSIFLVSVGRPIHMLIVEPIVFPTGLMMSINQSMVFAYYVMYALLFEKEYGFNEYEVGMSFAPLVIGSILAVPVVGVCDRVFYQPARMEALARGTTVAPEKRLYPAMIASVILPISLFWLAWSGRKGVHWIVPVISGSFFGTAYLLNLICLPIYANDIYTAKFGASVQAACGFMRFILAAAFPLFVDKMVHDLGFAWATSVFGFISVGLIPIPWVFFKYGPALRRKSQYLKSAGLDEII